MPEKSPIHHVSFPNGYLLAATFLRFQEHYESPKFRGKFFDLETYMDWYASTHGAFTYFTDWGGFNIPSRILTPFREGAFGPLSRKEQALLRLLEDVPEPFYVIGTTKTHVSTLAHEYVHGMYYCHPEYAAEVRKTVAKHRPKKIFEALGEGAGYDPSVFPDETNAYVLTGYDDPRMKAYPEMTKALGELFKEHFGWSIRDRRTWKRIPGLIHRHRFPTSLKP